MHMADDFKIEFTNNAEKIKKALGDSFETWLTDSAQVLKSQVRDLTRVKTGKTKNSVDYVISSKGGEMEAKVGSPDENFIWEELGTGEYALEGNGRKGGWYYEDENGEGHFTRGKTPSRALYYAIKNAKPAIESRLKDLLGGVFKG